VAIGTGSETGFQDWCSRNFSQYGSTRARLEAYILPTVGPAIRTAAKEVVDRMQYMITWNERQQGSPIEYENAQKRILEVFSPWKAPANFKILSFVIRVGDWGGYMLMECNDPLEVHKFCSMLPAFTFEARPVIPVADAIRVELEAMAYRDGLKSK
jgi:Protein of unknown function (DUF3303)